MAFTTMVDWKEFWTITPQMYGESDFLRQVGKTVGGVPICSVQVGCIIQQLKSGLALQPDDVVLDLCCGNGLITQRVAGYCRQIVGIDFSAPLLRVARKHHAATNLLYFLASVQEITPELLSPIRRFSKVYMYEALQHFDEGALPTLLRIICECLSPDGLIYLGSIPDLSLMWHFYDTAERRLDYYRRRAQGTEAVGTWWRREVIVAQSAAQGFSCELIDQDPTLHTAHYRFDAVLRRTEAGQG